MADADGHFGSAALDKLHKKFRQTGTTEGGACLTGHDGSFSKKQNENTCNYRFQAFKQAHATPRIKNMLHSYSTATIPSRIKTSAWKKKSPEYCAYLPKPRPGDWDLDGPTIGPIHRKNYTQGPVTIPAGMNFSQELWPYWNNAHHLIPKGTLKAKILEQKDARVSELIQKSLLTVQYNINHKPNMLLMPQDKRVADILGLPRHIQLRDKDAPGVAAICANHPIYNKLTCEIDRGLNSIVASYAKTCKGAITRVKGTHKKPKANLNKERLIRLSRRLLTMILGAETAGAVSDGQSLDQLAKSKGF